MFFVHSHTPNDILYLPFGRNKGCTRENIRAVWQTKCLVVGWPHMYYCLFFSYYIIYTRVSPRDYGMNDRWRKVYLKNSSDCHCKRPLPVEHLHNSNRIVYILFKSRLLTATVQLQVLCKFLRTQTLSNDWDLLGTKLF